MGYGDFNRKICLILAHFSSPVQALTRLFLTDDTRLFEKKMNGFLAAQTRAEISHLGWWAEQKKRNGCLGKANWKVN